MDVAAPELSTALDEWREDVGALLGDLLCLQDEADALLASISQEQQEIGRLGPPGPPTLAERVLPLSLKDVAPEHVPIEGMRRQVVRLERESAHLRQLGAELLDLCRDVLARSKAGRDRSEGALEQARRSLDVSRAAAVWSQRVVDLQRAKRAGLP
jgi:hypothetical protein